MTEIVHSFISILTVTNFTLTSHASLTLLEGERRTGAVVVVKTNNTVLTYNVTLTVGVLTSSAGWLYMYA